jgi:hypothetical protein
MKIETDSSFYQTDETYLRSSAIKSFESCSWLYWQQYVQKVPQIDNRGALQGSVVHSFFECLINPRHKHIFNKIMFFDTLRRTGSAERLVRRLMKKENLPNEEEIFDKIDKMILVGCKEDFYVEGYEIVGVEYRFKIKNEDPYYRLYGTMDKVAKKEKEKEILIQDYKSSKLRYSGEDAESNIQALCYCLACKKIWPEYHPKIRFLFLQYPESPVMEMEFTDEVLAGFEYFLAESQKKFDSFTEKSAWLNFAADQGYPEDGHFGGSLVCGYGKYPGHLKKNLEPYWVCSYKWSRTYYIVKKDGKIIKSYTNKEDIILKDGEIIEEVYYEGCPKFKNVIKELPITQVVKQYKNVLEEWDF